MSDYAIEVEHVSKRYRMQRIGTRTLKSAFVEWLRGDARRWGRMFPALTDLSFAVRRREALGIVGANGAGKSTLLSLIAGTMAPTEGWIRAEGKISSLLELGTGFHPDLTGRENVFLYGAIMGLSRRRMEERFDAIVQFAELPHFIDQPVKHYSSGMYVRLGFAVAVEVDPDILLVDEVLAVGDAAFRHKCVQRINEFKSRGKTMLMISHDMETIRAVSDRILFLDEGRIVADGAPSEIISRYETFMREKHSERLEKEWGTRDAVIESVEFTDAAGTKTDTFRWGEPMRVRLRYRARRRIEKPVFGFAIAAENGTLVNGNNTQIEGFSLPFIEGEGSLVLEFDRLTMQRGKYLFSFSLHSWDHEVNYHRLDNRFVISIASDGRFEGMCHLPCRWRSGGESP